MILIFWSNRVAMLLGGGPSH